jgi:transcriptional regulator with XRE-family HTH domain
MLGLSQAKLAERLDAAPTYIAMIESGKKFPSVDMLERIAAALEIDSPELFSMNSFPLESLKMYQAGVLADIGRITEQVLEEKLRELERKG